MAYTFGVTADDVLAGKVDLDALQGPYILLASRGTVGSAPNWEKLIRAANHMAKFGWRPRGIDQGIMLMEKATSV